jgi:hypothetical protein
MARPVDKKAKERKQKIFLGVGGVLLLALLAYQLPKLLKGSGAPPAPVAAATTTTATGTSSPSTAATGAAPGAVVSAQVSFAAPAEKLASLSLFRMKDPFKQGVDSSAAALPETPAATPTPAAPPTPAAATVTTPVTPTAGTGPLFGTIEGPSSGVTKTKTRTLPGATIMLNGKRLRIALGEAFPKSKPVFRLAGIQAGSVSIALVKGGLADGSSAIKLPKRHPVTLVNTVDKRRYTIVLLTANKKGV